MAAIMREVEDAACISFVMRNGPRNKKPNTNPKTSTFPRLKTTDAMVDGVVVVEDDPMVDDGMSVGGFEEDLEAELEVHEVSRAEREGRSHERVPSGHARRVGPLSACLLSRAIRCGFL